MKNLFSAVLLTSLLFVRPVVCQAELFKPLTTQALAWNELEPSQEVVLSQALRVASFSLPAETQFTILGSVPLEGTDVLAIDTTFAPCEAAVSAQKLDLQMIDANYGMELNPGCKISFYLELTDYYKRSFFRELIRGSVF